MSANHAIKGYIPIRPDLLQFVVWRENLPDKSAPLRLPGQGAICNYLTDLIEFGRSIYLPAFTIEREPLELSGLTARLRFECAPGFLDESFFQYADLVAFYFNEFLHQQWKETAELWASVALRYNPAYHRKDAIADLHEVSGIGDLREWESDIRANRRFRDYRNTIVHRKSRVASGE